MPLAAAFAPVNSAVPRPSRALALLWATHVAQQTALLNQTVQHFWQWPAPSSTPHGTDQGHPRLHFLACWLDGDPNNSLPSQSKAQLATLLQPNHHAGNQAGPSAVLEHTLSTREDSADSVIQKLSLSPALAEAWLSAAFGPVDPSSASQEATPPGFSALENRLIHSGLSIVGSTLAEAFTQRIENLLAEPANDAAEPLHRAALTSSDSPIGWTAVWVESTLLPTSDELPLLTLTLEGQISAKAAHALMSQPESSGASNASSEAAQPPVARAIERHLLATRHTVQLAVGATQVPLGTLNTLEPGDLVLLEASQANQWYWLHPEQTAVGHAATRIPFPIRYQHCPSVSVNPEALRTA